jgi:ribosomal protein S18 acetylase RimI-like enzyme
LSVEISLWTGGNEDLEHDLEELGALLHDCVRAGASVSFVLPFSTEEAVAFWRDQVLPAALRGTRRVLVARIDGVIAGTVQLDLDTPPNQPHRAEVKKLLVHPRARRRGAGRALMEAAEAEARAARRTLLTLDTAVGSYAEPLYRSMGYTAAGVIPGYAYNYDGSAIESTIVMWKAL